MNVRQALSRALLGLGLLLAAPGLAACGADPGTEDQRTTVGSDVGGGGPTLEATGRAEDTGDRAGHGLPEGEHGLPEGEHG